MVETLKPAYLPQVKPGDLPDLAVAMARSGLALMLYGSPGIGKTALLQGLGREPRLAAWASEQCGERLAALPVVTLSAPELKAVLAALGERDDTAEICRDRDGQPEPDADLRDTETVPETRPTRIKGAYRKGTQA